MNLSLTFATAGRVLTQLRRDHRTLGMIIVIPCVLVTLIKFVVGDDTWARIGLPLVGIFPLVIMFLITSIAMLRERSSGTTCGSCSGPSPTAARRSWCRATSWTRPTAARASC